MPQVRMLGARAATVRQVPTVCSTAYLTYTALMAFAQRGRARPVVSISGMVLHGDAQNESRGLNSILEACHRRF